MSSQGMLLASCCCARPPFFCEDWQSCLPRRAMLNISFLEVLEEIVGGTPRFTKTTSKVVSCELESVENASGQRLYMVNRPGGSASYFDEQLFYEVPRYNQSTGGGFDNPMCAIPCNTPYLCRRDAQQLTAGDGSLDVQVRCNNPCSGTPAIGESYTNITVYLTGILSATTTFSNIGMCFNSGNDGTVQVPGSMEMNIFDIEPRCVGEFGDYWIDRAGLFGEITGVVGPCSPSPQGFVCDPSTPGMVISATPAMSIFLESCPELVCEDFICLAPDPSDPFGVVVISECGCANIYPGSSAANNTAGERIRIFRRQVQSNVSLVVTEP